MSALKIRSRRTSNKTLKRITSAETRRALLEIENVATDLENKKFTFLRERGWNYSCYYRGEWLWRKRLRKGGTIYVPLEQAVDIERSKSPYVIRTY